MFPYGAPTPITTNQPRHSPRPEEIAERLRTLGVLERQIEVHIAALKKQELRNSRKQENARDTTT